MTASTEPGAIHLRDQEEAHNVEKKELRARIKELETQVAALYGKISS